MRLKEEETVINREMQERLWRISLELCRDEKTIQIATNLQSLAGKADPDQKRISEHHTQSIDTISLS
jgi:hypothetical protein